ncbi:MAG: O-antigen ligase family protein [Candidatus Thiodiazotropha sp. (ex Epidulcina cf. delphinae)]|nr:O-antigen ligase family protein [Candidatus Thiodiazotropha sp. (ex Epidulcina cf. delphinae)]
MITAVLFLIITFGGYIGALFRNPFWGLIVYANIYFNAPDPEINWWANYLPDLRWSLITAVVMVVSVILHRDKLSKHKYRTLKWMFAFYVLIEIEAYFFAINPEEAEWLTRTFQTYCITAFLLLKSLATFDQLRLFLLVIIALAGSLSIKAYTEGEQIHGRLENIGPGDAFSSNEFGILLASIIPLILPYLLKGKRYERVISLIALVFTLNAFILCNSRGAFVSLIFGIFYAFILVANKKIRRYIIIAAIAVIPVFIYLTDENFANRISSLWTSSTQSEDALNELSTGRVAIWMYGLEMAKDHPLGVGPEGFRELSRFYMPEENLTVHPGAEHGVRAAHNSYLQVLVEQGVLGLIVYMIICFYTLFLLIDSAKQIKKSGISGSFLDLLIVALNISFVVSLMGGMFGSQVYYEFFWWQVVISLVAHSMTKQIISEKVEKQALET